MAQQSAHNAPAGGKAPPRIWATLDPYLEPGPVLGRKVANLSFLKALFAADPYDAYHFYLVDDASCESVREWTAAYFPKLSSKVHTTLHLALGESILRTPPHCMHLSSPVERLPRLMQIRNAYSRHLFPITGVTHSLSYADFAAHYAAHIWQGTTERDALIVTSECARLVMERSYATIREGYGLDPARFFAPRLATIPLGVESEALPAPAERWDSGQAEAAPANALRERYGIAGTETLFLCLARFSPYSKMDLMPLFAAFRRAHALGLAPGSYSLMLAGWAEEEDELPERFASYAAALGIKTHLCLRPDDAMRRTLYAAADVFVSPSDNIQETFGLTVAEAITASLPVVASEFDGYRDIITEKCGILAPTLGFAESAETDVQALFWFDNQYHLKMAQGTAVDVPALAAALARLGSDAALRKRMGEKGRERGCALFSWEAVIKRYVKLWDELAAAPITQEREKSARAAAHPLRMCFAKSFAGHFTQTLDETTLAALTIQKTGLGDAVYRKLIPMQHYAGLEYCLDEEAARFLLMAARKPICALTAFEKLRERFPVFSSERAAFTLLWALKHDYIEKV